MEIDKEYTLEEMIMKELETNMNKYGEDGKIDVNLTNKGSKEIIATNKKKSPYKKVYSTKKGMKQIEKSVKKLGGTIEIVDNTTDYTVTITLPVQANSPSDNRHNN